MAHEVFATVADVQVPHGTRAGAAFTVRVMGTRSGKRVALPRRLWAGSGMMPIIVSPSVTEAAGPRHAQRPSALARAASGAAATQGGVQYETTSSGVAAWATAEHMPFEMAAEDCGWLPGPVGGIAGRPMPTFRGPAMGARDRRLTSRSSARQIMAVVAFSDRFKQLVVRHARGHCHAWRETHSTHDSIERAFHAANLLPEHVELWYAASLCIAEYNAAVPARSLWEPRSRRFNPALAKALPYQVWQWLNRHLSFGQYGAEHADDPRGAAFAADDGATQRHDRYRKRREASDIARALAGVAMWPSQHLGFDDAARPTRHGEGIRLRHKAAIHTGRPVDALNCVGSNYFMWWEEQGWLGDEGGGEGGGEGSREGGNHGDTEGGSAARGSGNDGGGGPSAAHDAAAAHGRGGGAARGGRARGGRGRGGGRNGGRGGGVARGAGAATSGAGLRGGGADGEADAAGTEAHAAGATGVNSMASRVDRATSVLRPHVGHCLWFDQGVTTLETMHRLKANGFEATGVIQHNRIGLPRRCIALLKQRMACPSGCSHLASADGCKRWSWAALHKGEWELNLWSDGAACVLTLSSCTSATRCVTLSRTVGSHCRRVQCPEGVGLYNLFGRSPTDIGDQHRKRLSLGARRRLRQGTKGALFDAEIGYVNGSSVANQKGAASKGTVWDFASCFCEEILAEVSMRVREPAQLAAQAHTRGDARAHEPIDFSDARRKHARTLGDESECPPAAKRGHECARDDCDAGEPRRPRLYCPGCARAGKHGWYHWACYWRSHCAQLVE